MKRALGAIERVKRVVAKARGIVARVRKFLIVAVPAVGLLVGADLPVYVDVVNILVAIGVYRVPNVPGE